MSVLGDTIWLIAFLADADEVTKNPSLENSSFTLQEAINKYMEYMDYWNKKYSDMYTCKVKKLSKLLQVTKKTVCRNKILGQIKKLKNAHTKTLGV